MDKSLVYTLRSEQGPMIDYCLDWYDSNGNHLDSREFCLPESDSIANLATMFISEKLQDQGNYSIENIIQISSEDGSQKEPEPNKYTICIVKRPIDEKSNGDVLIKYLVRKCELRQGIKYFNLVNVLDVHKYDPKLERSCRKCCNIL